MIFFGKKKHKNNNNKKGDLEQVYDDTKEELMYMLISVSSGDYILDS